MGTRVVLLFLYTRQKLNFAVSFQFQQGQLNLCIDHYLES